MQNGKHHFRCVSAFGMVHSALTSARQPVSLFDHDVSSTANRARSPVAIFISNLSLPRRTFLRGVGASVALPLLEAMVPALTATAKTAATGRLRFGAVYIPHGAIMDRYTPASAGLGFEFSPILKPLESVKEHVVVVSNLDRPGNDDSHATASAAWLSGAVARKTEGQDFRLGTTV